MNILTKRNDEKWRIMENGLIRYYYFKAFYKEQPHKEAYGNTDVEAIKKLRDKYKEEIPKEETQKEESSTFTDISLVQTVSQLMNAVTENVTPSSTSTSDWSGFGGGDSGGAGASDSWGDSGGGFDGGSGGE